MTDPVKLRPLLQSDGPRVCAWIEDWLFCHIGDWGPFYGLAWDPNEIRAHIERHALVEREWNEIVRASTDVKCLVRLIDENGEGAGIVYAELTEDRYLKLPVGVVSWLYVDPAWRGTRIAAKLLAGARDWHVNQGAIASEVFATISNSAAVRSYVGAGFVPVDYRLVAKSAASDEGARL